MISNKIKATNIFFIVLCVFFVSLFAVSFDFTKDFNRAYAVNEQEAEIVENGALHGEYDFNDYFKAPELELLIGGEYKKADICEVFFPSGKKVNGFENFIINEYGKFSIRYSKIVDGTEYYCVKTFCVYKNAYTTDSVRTTCQYEEQIEMSDAEESGIHLKLELNRGFYYEKPIPVSSLTGRGDFITFYPYIEEYYKSYSELIGQAPSASNPLNGATVAAPRPFEISFKLTDSADADNYVVVTYSVFLSNTRLESKAYALYHRAYANGQKARGWTQNDLAANTATTQAICYNGTKYSVWANENYGTLGFCHGPTVKNRPCTFGFNADNTEVVVSENGSSYSGERLVNVLNNYDLYGDNTFSGFKGSDVYLSVWVTGYAAVLKPYIEFDITQIGPYKGTGLRDDKFIDTTAPEIKVNLPANSVNVAKDAKYYPPSFYAYDSSGISEKGIRVYKLTDNKKSYAGSIDEYFVPDELGEYYLEYYAKDVFGNESTKTIKLNCKFNNGRGIAFFSSQIVNAKFGETITLPSYTISSLNTGMVDISIISPNGKVEIKDDTFVADCSGVYTINYHYYDEAYSYNFSYEFDVENSNEFLIYQKPLYETHYINNKKYQLDSVYVSTANRKDAVRDAVTYVFEDGETDFAKAKKIENGKDYLCTAENYVQFKVVYNSGTENIALYESKQIPIIKVYENDEFKLKNYFVLENCSVEVDSSKSVFTIAKTKDEAKIDFIGNVLLSNFDIKFQVPTGKANFETLTIRLADYYDNSNYFDIIYTLKKGYYNCQLNDCFVRSNCYEFANNAFEISYGNGVLSIYNQDKITYNYSPNFMRDKVRLSVIVNDVYAESEIEIHSINNIEMSLNTNDVNVRPAMGEMTLPAFVGKGEKISVAFAEVSDVLNPSINESISLTITAPNGTCLVKDYVMTGDYEFECSQSGEYVIQVSVFSQSEAYDEYEFIVESLDTLPPEINLVDIEAGTEIIHTDVGATVDIAQYSVSDADATVTVYCRDASGNITRVIDGKIVLDKAGTYTVFYYALGPDGALKIIDYNIRVVEVN